MDVSTPSASAPPLILALLLSAMSFQPRQAAVEFTPEEQAAIKAALEQLGGYAVAPENADKLRRVTTGRALFYYAVDRLKAAGAAEPAGNIPTRTQEIAKGVDAIRKAYRIHPLPLYQCDEARFMEARRDASNAIRLYRACIAGQASFKPDQFDEAVLRGRDVPAELREASERIKALGGL